MAITTSLVTIVPADDNCNWSGDPRIGTTAVNIEDIIDVYEFWVYCPDFPGVMVRCESYEEAHHILDLMGIGDNCVYNVSA